MALNSIFGFQPRDLLHRAGKTLLAGFAGVLAGWLVNIALTSGFGIFYATAAWGGYAVGFLVNFTLQVKMKNIIVKRA